MVKTYDSLTAARNAYPDRVIIWYPFHIGGQVADNWMWCAEQFGAVLDYQTKAALLTNYPGAVVFTIHRDGTVTAREL